MRLHFTVTQLRISILALNGLLALGVPAFAAYHYLGMGKPKDTVARVTKIHAPGAFTYVESGGATLAGQTQRAGVPSVATLLQPQAAPVIDTLPPDPTKVPDPETPAVAGVEDYQPGPLAAEPHNLEYVYFIGREDPTKTQVWLQKKAPGGPATVLPGGALGASSRANPKLRPTTSSSRTKRAAVKGMGQPSDRIGLFVGQREFKNDEQGLHFWIHSADRERFVYWMNEDIDKPKKTLYALKYVSGSIYVENPEKGLRPPEKSAEEIAAAEAEKPPRKFETYDYKDVEDTTETDYQKIFAGQLPLKSSRIFSDEAKARITGATSKGTPGATPTASEAAPGKITPARGPTPPSGPRKPTSEEMKQIKEGLKGIPKEAQDEVLKGLRGAK